MTDAIHTIAPAPNSQKRKFLEAQGRLSKDLQATLKALQEQGLLGKMNLALLKEEAPLRQMIQLPYESLADFRLRLARTEEWKRVNGTRQSIERFLNALGYIDLRFEKGREHDPARWNEVTIHLASRGLLSDTGYYLPFLLEYLKPAIAVFHLVYSGGVRAGWGQAEGAEPQHSQGAGRGSVHGRSRVIHPLEIRSLGQVRGSHRLPDFQQYDMDTYEIYDC